MNRKTNPNPNFKVGDLITGYAAGYFIITKIENRVKNAPLIHYKQIADSRGNPKAGKDACDASWCFLVDENYIDEKKKEFNLFIEKIQKLIDAN